MGVAEKFENFCSNIRISEADIINIRARYKRITKRLNSDFYGIESETANSLYVGSYGRGTDIHVSDIDMLFILPNEVYHQYNKYAYNGQSSLLQAVKTSLQKTYSTSHIGGDGQVVAIKFDDGIKFEIVPCFINRDNISFTHPNSNGGGTWNVTNPRLEIDAINQANKLYNKNLKRLCRMTRAWKDEWNVPIGGLLIDTLANNFMKTWEHKNESFLYFDLMTRDFFEFLKNQNRAQAHWLAVGSKQHIPRKGLFEEKASKCFDIATDACNYEATNKSKTATHKWREIYGTKF